MAKWKTIGYLEDVKPECLTEEGKQRLESNKGYDMEHPFRIRDNSLFQACVIVGIVLCVVFSVPYIVGYV